MRTRVQKRGFGEQKSYRQQAGRAEGKEQKSERPTGRRSSSRREHFPASPSHAGCTTPTAARSRPRNTSSADASSRSGTTRPRAESAIGTDLGRFREQLGVQRVELRSPAVEGLVAASLDGGAVSRRKDGTRVSIRDRPSAMRVKVRKSSYVLAVELETSGDLVDATRDLFVQNERYDNLFDLRVRNPELLRGGYTSSCMSTGLEKINAL